MPIDYPKPPRAVIRKVIDELGGIDLLVNKAAHQATFKNVCDFTMRRGS